MSERRLRALLAFAVFWILSTLTGFAEPRHILVCGSAQVLEGVIEQSGGHRVFTVKWYWRPELSRGLPLLLKSNFAGTDECKPVANGTQILITSSGNGLALVEHGSGNTLFYANVRNAHSAALLPGNLIVAASSFSPDGAGDRLLLYDGNVPDHPLSSLPFVGAHGVEWDSSRQVLWALSDRELARITVSKKDKEKEAQLIEQRTFPLPSRGGHDLVLAKDNSVLYLTTGREAFQFEPDSAKFSVFPGLLGATDVKSLSINPDTGQILYTQAEPGVWWTYTLKFLQPAFDITLSEHLYKARWYQPAPEQH